VSPSPNSGSTPNSKSIGAPAPTEPSSPNKPNTAPAIAITISFAESTLPRRGVARNVGVRVW
jgi:hypothetical protein